MNFSRSVLAVLFLLLSVIAHGRESSNSATLQQVHRDLLGKFTPKYFREGEQKLRNHSGEVPFAGDCVDYYVAAHHQLAKFGYIPYARMLLRKRDGEGHIVACVDVDGNARCLDPNTRSPVSLGKLHRVYRTVEIRRG